jgi:A/G-specific adenine glycosylase
VMDLAAGPCTRVAPQCGACPLAGVCLSSGTAGESVVRRPAVAFPATRRWLRGRLVASLTDGPAGTWRPLPDRLGIHDREAILDAASDLAREGFLELHEGRVRVRA